MKARSVATALLSLVTKVEYNPFGWRCTCSMLHESSCSFRAAKQTQQVSLRALDSNAGGEAAGARETVVVNHDGMYEPFSNGQNDTLHSPMHQDGTARKLLEEMKWPNVTLTIPVAMLNVVAVIWGSQHAVIKSVVDSTADTSVMEAAKVIADSLTTKRATTTIDPAVFNMLRFGLAATLASPYLPLPFRKTEDKGIDAKNSGNKELLQNDVIWRWGIELGLWMFLGFGFQSVGLQFTTAQRSGFLLYLNVKLVPLLARILWGREISIATWMSALTAFAGTALLCTGSDVTIDGTSMAAIASTHTLAYSFFNVGDAWSVAAATASAMFILRLETASAQISNAASLNAACLLTVALLSGTWSIASTGASLENLAQQITTLVTEHSLEIIYLGGITTALANWIQTYAQRYVSAERAAVIYAMDPVYGALFAYLWLGETLAGPQAWLGACLVTAAAVSSALWTATNSPNEDSDMEQRVGDDIADG